MPRRVPALKASTEEVGLLEAIVCHPQVGQGQALRARIVLESIKGKQIQRVATECGVNVLTVRKWRERFSAGGLAGLRDAARPGQPRKHDPTELRRRVLATLETPAPPGQACWDGPSVATHLGVNVHAVWRLLRKEGICLQRRRSWCVSTDPEFAAKAADVVALYLNPPLNALVLSMDEKPSIQAKTCPGGYVKTDNGKIVRGFKSTYKRNGTLNLFAALEVATGEVHGKTTETKRREDFRAFLEEVVANLPKDQEIHVILDNLSTHKNNEDWLAKYEGRVQFHFTPTSASWLNLVEVWFGLLTRKALRGASFPTKEALRGAIEAFIAKHNAAARPFKWRKREVKGAQLRNTIINLCN
jgi:transposase